MQFSSSRTLPGQWYAISMSMAGVEMRRTFLWFCLAVALHEVVGQQQDVGPPLPQRRDVDGEHVQPVVQVLAELLRSMSFSRSLLVAAIRRTSALMVERAADPLELPLLQDAQELDLHGRGQVSDLVEEERAALGQLEAALPRCHRAREGALLVAEQLALDHPFGQRGAVHLHERPRRAPAGVMDGVGHQLLARAAFPAQEHRGVACGDLRDELVDAPASPSSCR